LVLIDNVIGIIQTVFSSQKIYLPEMTAGCPVTDNSVAINPADNHKTVNYHISK
jgi:hypothetical protein